MKKILLGFLLVGALSACSNTPLDTQVEQLNETATAQTQQFQSLKTETFQVYDQVDELNIFMTEYE